MPYLPSLNCFGDVEPRRLVPVPCALHRRRHRHLPSSYPPRPSGDLPRYGPPVSVVPPHRRRIASGHSDHSLSTNLIFRRTCRRRRSCQKSSAATSSAFQNFLLFFLFCRNFVSDAVLHIARADFQFSVNFICIIRSNLDGETATTGRDCDGMLCSGVIASAIRMERTARSSSYLVIRSLLKFPTFLANSFRYRGVRGSCPLSVGEFRLLRESELINVLPSQ